MNPIAKAGQALTASGRRLPAVTITRQSGDSHRFSVADLDAYTGVIAYWHDHKKGREKGRDMALFPLRVGPDLYLK